MRGPGRSNPRRPLTDDAVHALLFTATIRLLEAEANDTGTPGSRDRRHAAWSSVVGQVHDTHERVFVTRNGEPIVVVMAVDDIESLQRPSSSSRRADHG